MPSGWRIDKPRRNAFSGEGARRFGGRWNSPGVAVVYLSEHQSLAALEIFVHLQPLVPHDKYLAYFVEWDEAQMEHVVGEKITARLAHLAARPGHDATGDQWVAEARSAVLAVPSAIVPAERNFLLNPAHPKFGQVRLHKPVAFTFDHRLAGR